MCADFCSAYLSVFYCRGHTLKNDFLFKRLMIPENGPKRRSATALFAPISARRRPEPKWPELRGTDSMPNSTATGPAQLTVNFHCFWSIFFTDYRKLGICTRSVFVNALYLKPRH